MGRDVIGPRRVKEEEDAEGEEEEQRKEVFLQRPYHLICGGVLGFWKSIWRIHRCPKLDQKA